MGQGPFRIRSIHVVAVLVAAFLLGGCASKPIYRTPRDPDRPGTSRSGPRSRRSVSGPTAVSPSRVEEVGSTWLGTPYRYGGVDERGIDCSALAQNVLGDLGARIPRTTKAQRHAGRPIRVHELRAGDLVFFRLESGHVNHVGIALGPDRFLHASSSRGVVVDRLMDDYFSRRVVEARRVLP